MLSIPEQIYYMSQNKKHVMYNTKASLQHFSITQQTSKKKKNGEKNANIEEIKNDLNFFPQTEFFRTFFL